MPLPKECGGGDLLVFSLLGRVYMGLPANDPFAVADELLEANPSVAAALVDVHMEATAEKAAMAFHLDGRVSTVLGTHTHVPTADARVLQVGRPSDGCRDVWPLRVDHRSGSRCGAETHENRGPHALRDGIRR